MNGISVLNQYNGVIIKFIKEFVELTVIVA
jgi:hypothetical protein